MKPRAMPAMSVMKADLPDARFPEYAEQENGGDGRRDVGDQFVDALEKWSGSA